MSALNPRDQDMKRIEIDAAGRRADGTLQPGTWRHAFEGVWLVNPADEVRGNSGTPAVAYGVALTKGEQFAVYAWHVKGAWQPSLEVYASLGDAAADDVPPNIVALAAEALGEEFVIELDI
jgi:hypothetical protein